MNDLYTKSLSIIIVSYNTRDYLRRCLTTLYQWPASIPQEVIVIDNASKDGSADMVAQEFPTCIIIRSSTNDGYGVAINNATDYAKGSLLMFLNPDIEISSGSLDTMLRFAEEQPRAGVIGPRLIYANGQPQPSARRFLSASMLLVETLRLHLLLSSKVRSKIFLGTYFNQDKTMEVPWVSGACHLIPRDVWEKVGPLTEETFCGSDDYDFCYRVRQKGYQVWLCSSSTMVHHCSVAVRQRWTTWEVEQVAMHNFYIILESHWPLWRAKIYYAAEILSCLFEILRHKIKPRREQDTPNMSYGERLKRRMALIFALLLGRKKPIRRFQPIKQGSI